MDSEGLKTKDVTNYILRYGGHGVPTAVFRIRSFVSVDNRHHIIIFITWFRVHCLTGHVHVSEDNIVDDIQVSSHVLITGDDGLFIRGLFHTDDSCIFTSNGEVDIKADNTVSDI